ncbi:hybrid sensor histidine kinase/response regulator [Ammoniphilus resinae]|uniref:histidine kinase n=1 Tax=Ammoniphilus resinae TaxID=861532 RepID=A0ABS4GJW2_9BACL|nr:ATP-binding protein [Ammoniphilus resinae]MBP1930205.1 sensor histidine kinase YesM [Ammoniphilus resinae]
MKRKWLAFLITLAMLAVTYGTLPYLLKINEPVMPKAINGVLDLRGWHFEEHDKGLVRLDGEWQFYPDQLLEHRDFALESNEPPADLMTVPGSWASRMNTIGKATYRLLIDVGKQNLVFGLKTLSIQMSARIFVNGQEIGNSGVPSDLSRYVGKNKPIVGYFPLQQGLNEVIVQVANYDFPASSGIKHSIYFGTSEQISELQSKAVAYDWISVTAFLIIGLYFIGMYTQRTKDRFLLIFGLMCMLIALFSSTGGERIIFHVFPDLSVGAFLRIQIVSTLCASISMFLYVYLVLRPFCSPLLIRIALLLGLIQIVLSLFFMSATYNSVILLIHSLYVSLAPVYMMYSLVLAALHRVEGSFYLAVAAIALNLYTSMQNLNVYFAVPIFSFPPIEPFLFLLMLSLLISLRFSNAYKQNELLSAQLLKADQIKDEFITKTAHEFKTPLHGLVHIAESMIKDSNQLSSGQLENLSLISSTAKRLSQLVYDILDFSRLKQGEMKVDMTPHDIHSVVDVVIKVFSFLTVGKEIRLINRVPKELPLVWVDENRIRQILSNLLDNAIKYTDSGFIEISAVKRDQLIEIIVTDTGVGIDEDNLETIFEPYKMLQPDSYQSFGLGLPIVKQLIELQQGSIWINSKKGQGTSVHFTLKIVDPEDGTVMQSANEKKGIGNQRPQASPGFRFTTPYISDQQGQYTVLVVDDHYSNLKVLIDLLEPLNYKVVAVKDGFEALKLIEEMHEIDLVILDLMMPGLSGVDVCREIREKYSLLELPVLMVTASIQPEDKITSFDAGANDFLTKPFDAAELKARVRGLLMIKESVGKAVDLEVAFLQSQIKPHFLYNVLNTIMALSYTDSEASRKMITDLADYLRGSFHFSNTQEKVPFHRELALIQSYVEIEKARFKDRIRVEYEISDDVRDVEIPPLLIQPLVENAIRHGIGNRMEGGMVRVCAYKAGNHCIFVIEDNGIGLKENSVQEKTSHTGVGLQNIRKRLKYAYGTELNIDSVEGFGTKVTIRIPSN